MAELTNNHKNLLRASVVGGVLLSGLFGWLSYEDYQARETALEQIAVKRGEIDRADAQIREIPRLEERIIVLRETVNSYVRILPDDKEITSFVEKLTEFATRSDIRVKKLDDEDVRARSGRNQKGATAAFDRVLYKLSVEGTCEQLLCFMDLFENHERFVKIGSFKIEHRDIAQANVDPMSILHQIDLDLETYVYNAKVKSRENVEIPQEPQKLERLKSLGLVGAESASDLLVASYDHDAAPDRRDLFYDPRLAGWEKHSATEAEKVAQRAALEDLVARLQRATSDLAEEAKIDNLVRRLQAVEKNNRDLVALGALIAKAKGDRVFTVDEFRDRFEREVDKPFSEMIKDRPLDTPDVAVLGRQIEEDVAKMRAAMGDSRWDEIVTLHEEVVRLSAICKGDDIKAFVKESGEMHKVAKAHLDFDARSMTFGGAVCFENDPAHAVVIINGRSYGPGETVDQELVVKTITNAAITFEFRGIVLNRPMKTSAPVANPAARSATPGSASPGTPRRKKT